MCTRFKQQPKKAEMVIIETTYPLELIHVDFLTIGKVDSAKTLWENFLVYYGWPTNILTDQGKTYTQHPIGQRVMVCVNALTLL